MKFKSRLKKENNLGFTLIETMIAMTIFVTIVIVGLGAILNAMNQHAVSQNMRTVMDNLNFIMEDMSRNMRLGTNFHCVIYSDETILDGSGVPIPQDCPNGNGSRKIVFRSVSGDNITYEITDPNFPPVQITKQIGSGTVQVFSLPEVTIDSSKSGFIANGTLPPPDDTLQPIINIGLSGYITYRTIKSTFSIQTTVASRPLDGATN